MSFVKKFLLGVLAALVILGVIWGIREAKDLSENRQVPAATPTLVGFKPLKFAVMSDIHLDKENFIRALKKAKADGAEFVIITGDLTSLGKKDELISMKAVLDQENLSYYAIPGNHDLWADNFKSTYFQQVFGPDYQSFKKDSLKFILIDNGSYFGLGEKQRAWLEEEVKECPRITCLVFAHMPFNHPTSLHIMGEGNKAGSQESKEIVKLLTTNGVEEVFAGHLHYHSVYELDGLKTTVVGAITSNRNLQLPNFLEIEVEGKNLLANEIFVAD